MSKIARVAAVGILLIGGVGLAGCSGASDTPPASPSPTTVGSSTVEIVGPLSYTVWSNVLGNMGGTVKSSSPLYPVTKLQDITDDTVRVFDQEQLTKAEKAKVGRQIFTLGAWDDTDLQTVVVRDASGVDSNYFRADVPGIKK